MNKAIVDADGNAMILKDTKRGDRLHKKKIVQQKTPPVLAAKPDHTRKSPGHSALTPAMCEPIQVRPTVRIIMHSGVVHATGQCAGKERDIPFRAITLAGCFFSPFSNPP